MWGGREARKVSGVRWASRLRIGWMVLAVEEKKVGQVWKGSGGRGSGGIRGGGRRLQTRYKAISYMGDAGESENWLRTSMYIEGTCKLQKNKKVSSQSEPAHCTTEDPLEHNDQMALRAHRVRALAVHGEVVVPPKDFGPVVRRASEALYARQRAARRLRREQRGRVGRAVQGFPDDAAHGAAAL